MPTFRRPVALHRCLRSLLDQSCPPEQYEILVIDNACDANTAAVIEELDCPGRVRYIVEPVPGLLAGRHRGALEAAADVLVFVDDDVRADREWLAAVLDEFADGDVGIVGGRSLPLFEADPPEWLEHLWRPAEPAGRFCAELSLIDLGEEPRDIDPLLVFGLNFAIRRRALRDLGGFHPDCVPDDLQMWQGDGETGLALEARRTGVRARYAPAALVHHEVPAYRLTAPYFQRRGFYQGICDSYTVLREGRRRSGSGIRRGLADLAWFLRSAAGSEALRSARRVRASYMTGYRDGYRFHQRQARRRPEVMEWIRRRDYWDYRLPHMDSGSPVCTLLMLVTPPELPVTRFTVPALRHAVRHPGVSVVIFANGLDEEQELWLANLFRGLPRVTLHSNRTRIEAQRSSMRIGDWYTTEAGRSELRVGLYESAPEIWERELPALDTPIVGMIDADFEFLSADLMPRLLAAFGEHEHVAVVSTDHDAERPVYDSYSQQHCILAARHHTWCCLYRHAALQRFSDFSYHEEVREGQLHKYDHSARLQQELFRRGYTGRSLDPPAHHLYVHYGAFAQNRSLAGGRLSLYRTLRLGKHNGWMHVHRMRLLAWPLRLGAVLLYRALRLHRYDRERSRYRWEQAPA